MRLVFALVLLCLLLAACVQEPMDQRDALEDEYRRVFTIELMRQNDIQASEIEDLSDRLQECLFERGNLNESCTRCTQMLSAWEERRWDVPSPSSHVPTPTFSSEQVILNLSGAIPIFVTDTNSMDPLVDVETTVIGIRPQTPRDIGIGDIIGYHCAKCGDITVMHRVVGIGKDKDGIYFITKGDNNPAADPWPVRYEEIQVIVVGFLY